MDEQASIKEQVREAYAREAQRVVENSGKSSAKSGCCGSKSANFCGDPITSDLYQIGETSTLPADAIAASRGCGNPTALAELKPGEVVLDLGSGGGIDVLLSARRVGPAGKAYGLDMTDEMLALARENQRQAQVQNAEFLKGEIENIPLPDNSVDVIISNCVINLSADKDRVLRDTYRVLKPGGRLAISDIVVRGALPTAVRNQTELWSGCIAGALEESDYRAKLSAAGFEAIDVEPTRIFSDDQTRELVALAGLDEATFAAEVAGKFMSAFVRARKPR
jgi:arsenite methyltransferase